MTLRGYLAASAGKYGKRPALAMKNKTYRYVDLHQLAKQFSWGLTLLDIAPQAHIALWLPKCEQLYISVFGCVEGGCAYVPVDINAPVKRVAYMLKDACCRLLICRDQDYRRLEAEGEIHRLKTQLTVVLVDSLERNINSLERNINSLERDKNSLERDKNDNPPASNFPPILTWLQWMNLIEVNNANLKSTVREEGTERSLAYILYTSGSTGNPKGVAISREAAVAFVEWAANTCELNCEDRIANHASLSFDLSIFDLFATLYAGACLYPVPNWPLGGGYLYAKFIQENRISVWYSVPTVLDRITDSQQQKALDLSSLRMVIFAGEPFAKTRLRQFAHWVSQARLHNWYGPTETNVCTFHQVTEADLRDDGPLPIGKPCAFAQIVLEHDEAILLNEGARTGEHSGEILVAGKSLMSGYWRQGGLDRSPLINRPNHKGLFYKTGDFAVEDNGVFLYKGRKDVQIKRNGHRIELTEISNCIGKIGQYKEVEVLYSAPDIIAFITAETDHQSHSLSSSMLREQLATFLPPYMLPAQCVFLPALPRTDRGKVDRRKLLQLVSSDTSQQKEIGNEYRT